MLKKYYKSLVFYDKVIKDLIPEELQKSVINIGLKRVLDIKINYKVIKKNYELEDLKKLNKKNDYKIIAFYSLLQFCYEGKTKINIIEYLVKKKYYLFFSREKLLIKNEKEFKKNYYNLIIFPITNNRLLNTIIKNFNLT